MLDPSNLQMILAAIIPVLFAITIHEYAHGYIANKLGDNTALLAGRLSINPIKHIDLVGTVIIPSVCAMLGGFIFGWAKPVPVNWQRLHYSKIAIALVAIAGPMANLGMAFTWLFVIYLSASSYDIYNAPPFIFQMAIIGLQINILLLVLNMIPIPPLDGSRVITILMSNKLISYYYRLEPYGLFILLALLMTGGLGKIIFPAMHFLQYSMLHLVF